MAQNEPQRKETPPGPPPNSPSLLFEYQCRSGKFIRLANQIEIIDLVSRIDSNLNFFCLNWNALLFIGLFIFRSATSVEQRVFHRHVCLSVTSMYCAHGLTRQLADMPTREITWSRCKNDWTDRVAIWRVDWPRLVSFCVRWVTHPKSAVRDFSWRRSLLVIKYFADLYRKRLK